MGLGATASIKRQWCATYGLPDVRSAYNVVAASKKQKRDPMTVVIDMNGTPRPRVVLAAPN